MPQTSRSKVRSTSNPTSVKSRGIRQIALFVLAFAALGITGTAFIHANSALTPPATDTAQMIGLNGTYNSDTYVADAGNLGVKWMRVEQWGDNASFDTVPATLTRLSAQNIRMLPLVNNYNTSWVTDAGKQQWVAAITHTAVTYGKGGTFWQGKTDLGSPVIEVGNEVYGSWFPWPDQGYLKPGEYAKMVKQAAIAVNQQTGGRVKLLLAAISTYNDTNDLSAGPGGTFKSWSDSIKQAVPDIEQYIGGVTAHPYGDIPQIGLGTSTDPNWSHQLLYTVHQNWNVPVYVTEVGQKAQKVGPDMQAKAVNYYFDELKNNSWEAGLFLFNQKDYQPYDPNGDNGWALIDYQDVRQPAWTTYQTRATSFVPPTTVDTTPPTVALTSPAAGSTVSGTVALGAYATDNVAVAGVQFAIDGKTIGSETTSAPYTLSWNSTTVANGNHTIAATARDTAGNTVSSAAATITVANPVAADTAPPSTPTTLAVITKTATRVSLTWQTATDTGGSGLVGYRVYRNNTLVGTTASNSYTDSGLAKTTFYSYTVRAYDAAGNTSLPSSVLKVRTANH